MDDCCTSFERERIKHANLKGHLRKRKTFYVSENSDG